MLADSTIATKESREAESVVTNLAITGMTCGNCARHVTQAIQAVPGVHNVDVSLEAHSAKVSWAPGQPRIEAVIKAVKEEGYGARVAEERTHSAVESRMAGWQVNVLLGLPVTLALMAGEWALRLGMQPWYRWLSFALAALVQVIAGARFYRGAWNQLRAGNSNMDTLVALGSTTAFGYSTWALFTGQPGHLYFMEAAAIITLISVGHWMESRVSVKASGALRKLLNLAPEIARRRGPDGAEAEVPVAELRPADVVVLRAGDRVPTDGTVLEGHSAVDESMLTGESIPIDKEPAHELYAGTVNLNGLLTMQVTATGEQTALAHIIAAVQRAQNSRAGIQRIGDRISSVFVPAVILIALAAGLWWGLAPNSAWSVHHWLAQYLGFSHLPGTQLATAFIVASAVLIIACPCAMGLATPAAIMAGSNAAAQRGILIRDGVALEKAGGITAVVFDKTGTLTAGKPEVVGTWIADSHRATVPSLPDLASGSSHPDAKQVEWMAGSLARRSSHPISHAVALKFPADGQVKDWLEIPGSGVQATIRQLGTSDISARLGSLRWLTSSGADITTPGNAFINHWTNEGSTVVGLTLGTHLAGLFAIRDTLKPGAADVISRLQRQGLKTLLVTGDNRVTAAAIARQAGIDPALTFAEVRPEEKANFIRTLQAKGERVAFVGDGINDSPALEQADLGVAVSRASDIAREAADIILLKSDIQAVPESLGLARATLRTIKQNLFWAFFYNAAGIPLAALGFMSPVLCAAAMGVSDLIVIGNALRLLRWRS